MSARDSGFVDSGTPQHQHQQPMMGSSKPMDALSAPDLLTAAFNAAVKPYTDRIAQLEEQMHNMSAQLQRFEQERHIICSWIDKRGLRAGMFSRLTTTSLELTTNTFTDVPPEMTAIIDSTPDAAQQLHRAIDRKVTIVNFDLHRLQDDLGESISVGYFSTCMLKIVPELHRLSHLTGGAALAHEQIIKMVGNLTSHLGSGIGEGKTQEEVDEDKHAQESFFREIDEVLYGVTKQRERQQGGEFEVERELKRMTKNSEYLKQLGIFGYFPRTIGYLQQIGGHSQQREYDGGHGGQASPDRY